MHRKFYVSVVISVIITHVVIAFLIAAEKLFRHSKQFVFAYKPLYIVFLLIALGDNWYQVFAHIFTATTFMGYKKIVPLGADEYQSLTNFIISDIGDIIGWMLIFVYYGYGPFVLVILAAVHYSSGIVAILFKDIFHKYYIGEPDKYQNKVDNFGYKYWRLFKVVFVLIDAVSRAYVSCIMSVELYQLIIN